MTKTILLISVFLLTLITGCATQRSQPIQYAAPDQPSSWPVHSSLTSSLKSGMTPVEVQSILGTPDHVESWTASLLWTYAENSGAKTTVKFDQKTQTLKDWQTLAFNPTPRVLTGAELQAFRDQAFGVQAPVRSGVYMPPLTLADFYRPKYTYKTKTTVKHHKDGRTTYKTKIKRKY